MWGLHVHLPAAQCAVRRLLELFFWSSRKSFPFPPLAAAGTFAVVSWLDHIVQMSPARSAPFDAKDIAPSKFILS
ncbi:hypothetical protein K470DRAFT_254397 [Piedraia hortae CBS 480.64]|uniref:Uncharacterized protein n=1 Tax=Piedraia hortae CBS 480.64 TaxID=1314780 RepID=A0A6A7C9Y2_9PEZI|nr:hypothetical protein K470DRAFT_254397 [Piedraia hortae CBS 480.64]